MNNLWIVILAMGVVTYVPRMLPIVLLKGIKLPPFIKSFFRFIPFAALGALIFPGVLSSTGSLDSAVTGAVLAVLLSLFAANPMIPVFGGIAGVCLWQLLSQFI